MRKFTRNAPYTYTARAALVQNSSVYSLQTSPSSLEHRHCLIKTSSEQVDVPCCVYRVLVCISVVYWW